MKQRKEIFPLLTILLTSLVSAGPVEGVQQLLSGLGQIILLLTQFISDTILNINSFDEFLFAKLLLFTIILLIVYTVIKRNPILGGNKTIHWIISSAISILSIRYISDEFIQAILIQYGALAVGLTIFLPLMIYFFFIHQSGLGPAGRRVGWMVFIISFLALWLFRYDELGEANWIYWIGMGVAVFAVMLDKKIHKHFQFSDFRKVRARHRSKMKRGLMRDLKTLDEDLANGIIERAAYDREIKDIKDRIVKLSD